MKGNPIHRRRDRGDVGGVFEPSEGSRLVVAACGAVIELGVPHLVDQRFGRGLIQHERDRGEAAKGRERAMPRRPHHQPPPPALLDPPGLSRAASILFTQTGRTACSRGRAARRAALGVPADQVTRCHHDGSPGPGRCALMCSRSCTAAPAGSSATCRFTGSDHSKNPPEASTVTHNGDMPFIRITTAGRASLNPRLSPSAASSRHNTASASSSASRLNTTPQLHPLPETEAGPATAGERGSRDALRQRPKGRSPRKTPRPGIASPAALVRPPNDPGPNPHTANTPDEPAPEPPAHPTAPKPDHDAGIRTSSDAHCRRHRGVARLLAGVA